MDSKSKYFQYCAQKAKAPARVIFETVGLKPPKFTAAIAADGFNFISQPCDSKKAAEVEIYDRVFKTIGIHVVPSKFNINNLVDSLVGDESYCEMYYKDIEGVHCTIIYKEGTYSAIAPSRSYARSLALQSLPDDSLKFSSQSSN